MRADGGVFRSFAKNFAEGRKEITDEYQKHNFKRKSLTVKQCYSRCTDVLDINTDYKADKVHGARSYLINAPALHDKALVKMKEDPYYFVDLPEGYVPGAE